MDALVVACVALAVAYGGMPAGVALVMDSAYSFVGGGEGLVSGAENTIWMSDRPSASVPPSIELGFIR